MGVLKKIDGTKKVRLADFDPNDHDGINLRDVESLNAQLGAEMTDLQDIMYAAQDTGVLIVLQGLDTAGKDGTIRRAIGYMNPQSCRVAAFKVPTPLEMSHDFLWRVHAETPARGFVSIFNRSHYEDVLVVRVHDIVPKQVWEARYEQINFFESLLTSSGTIVLKFFLHISKDEQKKRLLARAKDSSKAWKLSTADWKERELWDKYQEAYEAVLNRCATPNSPWYVVPANNKKYRNFAVAETIVETLRPYRYGWLQKLQARGVTELKEIEALQQNHG
jgi:PPK2 family polyphosphate:nucleotide phosphotransferase